MFGLIYIKDYFIWYLVLITMSTFSCAICCKYSINTNINKIAIFAQVWRVAAIVGMMVCEMFIYDEFAIG